MEILAAEANGSTRAQPFVVPRFMNSVPTRASDVHSYYGVPHFLNGWPLR
jgi:hypothetical protein